MTGTLVEILLPAGARHAARAALWARAGTRTYAELWRGAEQVAARLAAHGVGRGARVALWTEKTPVAVEAVLGTWLVGAAVVPLDARAPVRRVARMVADAAPAALVVDRLRVAATAELGAALADARVVLAVGLDDPPPATAPGPTWERLDAGTGPPPVRAPAALEPDAPAYLLYTSGSTGMPKAVVITHGAARAFVDWARATVAPTPEDRFASHAPLHFDLSVLDLWVALSSGASVRLLDATEAMLAPWLVEQVRAWGITVWYSVPSILVAMLERGGLARRPWPALRWLLFAGEVFPPRHLEQLRRAHPGARLANLYGPTETNVCTWYEVTGPVGEGTPVPIGTPCAHVEAVVLDDALRAVPAGAVGELWVGGPSLLAGYWNDAVLTAARLRPDPRPGRTGRLYRTGDRVVRGADGLLRLVGRVDDMVKRRGHRIELGDIEAALLEHPAAAAAAVVAIAVDGAGVRIDAYVAGRAAALAVPDLEAHLRARLPAAMLPDRVLVEAALPRTSTGKIDRVALADASRRAASPRGSR